MSLFASWPLAVSRLPDDLTRVTSAAKPVVSFALPLSAGSLPMDAMDHTRIPKDVYQTASSLQQPWSSWNAYQTPRICHMSTLIFLLPAMKADSWSVTDLVVYFANRPD